MAATYFRRLMPGVAHSRYFIGTLADTGVFYVERTQISRPDGQEIHEPRRVTILPSVVRELTPARRRSIDAADHKRNARELQPAAPTPLPTTKRCARCDVTRKAAEFYIVTKKKQQGLHSYCKACVGEINAIRRRAA